MKRTLLLLLSLGLVSGPACGKATSSGQWDPIAPLGDSRSSGGGRSGGAGTGGAPGVPDAPTSEDTAAPPLVTADADPPTPETPPPVSIDVAPPDPTPPLDTGAPITDAYPDASDSLLERGCPRAGCRRVFVTSAGLPDGAFGSLSGADAHCQKAASAAGLGGGWFAWTSDASGSPLNRYKRSAMPYLLVDGTRVASSWDALVGGLLSHAIDVFENGKVVPASKPIEVWTGTTILGSPSGVDCGAWISTAPTGTIGLTNRIDRGWTQARAQSCKTADLHLYCFEQ